ncbi:MAG: hypothetical protein H6583_07995 [Alteromonas sp.]|nr:hypothetical protein [Alteromonas sp.]
MNKESFIDCERKRLNKILAFRLPHSWLYTGGIIAGVSIILMFVRAFALDGDTQGLRHVLQKTLLVGLLLMSIAKDKQEDEMLVQLRAQSYMMAFIVGVVYALVMPYVDFGVSSVVHQGGEVLKDLGDFQVLLFMLMIQLLFYHNLKRFR